MEFWETEHLSDTKFQQRKVLRWLFVDKITTYVTLLWVYPKIEFTNIYIIIRKKLKSKSASSVFTINKFSIS